MTPALLAITLLLGITLCYVAVCAASPFGNNGLGAHGCPSRSFRTMLSWRLARVKWRLIPLRADACFSARKRRTGG